MLVLFKLLSLIILCYFYFFFLAQHSFISVSNFSLRERGLRAMLIMFTP